MGDQRAGAPRQRMTGRDQQVLVVLDQDPLLEAAVVGRRVGGIGYEDRDVGATGIVGSTPPFTAEVTPTPPRRRLVRIGRFEPTSRVCSVCGVKDGPQPLHVREWACSGCGAVLDRDINAAGNVATAAGLAASARGAQVRPEPVRAQRDEAGTRRSGRPAAVGIPGS
ncbi:zinc ribbon domain-containing protein [Streptomonospora salina]|uniref:zinc ribbon domain-containing protein n=1 Tax=Streptomonospora salina TaxID=104205 RepID=UPI0028A979FD|nr:zinc ribbon domain-containing protein [Streptomonospora salina]